MMMFDGIRIDEIVEMKTEPQGLAQLFEIALCPSKLKD